MGGGMRTCNLVEGGVRSREYMVPCAQALVSSYKPSRQIIPLSRLPEIEILGGVCELQILWKRRP